MKHVQAHAPFHANGLSSKITRGEKDLRNFNSQLPSGSKTQAAEKETHESKFSHLPHWVISFPGSVVWTLPWCEWFASEPLSWPEQSAKGQAEGADCQHALIPVPEISNGCQVAGTALEVFWTSRSSWEERTIKMREIKDTYIGRKKDT